MVLKSIMRRLQNKNSDQIRQIDTYIDPVVARKIQIKLGNLVKGVAIPPELKEHFNGNALCMQFGFTIKIVLKPPKNCTMSVADALDVVTNYLAVELLEPRKLPTFKYNFRVTPVKSSKN